MKPSNFNEILNNKDKLLTQTYFELQRNFEERYGSDTVISNLQETLKYRDVSIRKT